LVTVGELWQWGTTRSWGPRTREDLELWPRDLADLAVGCGQLPVYPGRSRAGQLL
jgi:hypothetical protein